MIDPIHGSRPRTTAEISAAVKSRQKPVNHLIDLEVYFKTADFVGLQASIYREEQNWPELFRVLMAYCSLVVETIARHKDWTKDGSDLKSKKRAATCKAYELEVLACMDEMEQLKPRINDEAAAWLKKHPVETKPLVVPRPDDAPKNSSVKTQSPLEMFTDGDWDLLSATPKQLEQASAQRNASGASPSNRPISHTTLPRYTPKAEYVAASVALSETTSRHSLVSGGSVGQNVHPSALRSAAPPPPGGHYPFVDATWTAIPGIRADTSTRPPPPPGPPPSRPSAPPMASMASGQPPPPPLPPTYVTPSAIITSAASRDFTPQRMTNVPAPDFATKDHGNLENRLSLYGLKEKKVRGDGNCQFRALADQLWNNQERHAEIRSAVVDQLRRDSESYSVFVPEDYASYVRDMSRQTTWGDHITLQAAADTYGVAMCVISSYKDNFVIEIQPKVKRSERVLWISFWAEVHYNSIYHLDAKI